MICLGSSASTSNSVCSDVLHIRQPDKKRRAQWMERREVQTQGEMDGYTDGANRWGGEREREIDEV